MKKSLTAALTTALVVGAASTTLAAANPFSDVPADHWAYDAVAQLADDGVIEGYGDGTYRGQNEITRYEMAQMVAKAMAKEDQVNAQQKAMIDRLAAEFSEELNNLGVRVANLEDRIDNIKWTGELRYTYEREFGDTFDKYAGGTQTDNEILFRLEPEATVNDHWKVRARLDAAWNPDADSSDDDHDNHVSLERAYVEGTYGTTVIDVGKLPVFTEQGTLIDDTLSGAAVTFGAEQPFSGTIFAGRYNLEHSAWKDELKGARKAGFTGRTWADVQLVNLNWNPSEKFHVGADYVHLKMKDQELATLAGLDRTCNYWGLGMTWRPESTVALSGGYWKNTSDESAEVKNEHLKAYNIELAYKGAELENPRTFGLHLAYRYLGGGVVLAPTFDGAMFNTKGWEMGAEYTFAKNIVGTLIYFDGDQIFSAEPEGKTEANKLFARLEYFF